MGAASKVVLCGLRIWELICSLIVLGILASFLRRVNDADAPRDGRIVYGIVTASISTAFSIIFIAPFIHAFMAFPGDFILWVMWLVAFCLLETRTGIHSCNSPWFWNYWGFYWGRWWRQPVFVTTSDSGCGYWRSVLAFSFMAMFAFLVSTVVGTYGSSNYWSKKKSGRGAGTAGMEKNPQTSQTGPAGQAAGVATTGPGTGQPDTYATTGQPGTYATPGQPGTSV